MSDQPPRPLRDRLRQSQQEFLLDGWDQFSPSLRTEFLQQLDAVDFGLLRRLFEQRRTGEPREESPADRARRAAPPSQLVRLPHSQKDQAEWRQAEAEGRRLLSEGKVGAILVAGGQGTRLGFPHPKGMFALGPVSGKSLFQLFCEQLRARMQQAGTVIPYYLMTSDATHDETVAYFREHAYFGLDPREVRFFQQGTMPAVDAESGRLLLQEPGKLCTSPDGHGGILQALSCSGLLDRMRERQIEFLYYHQVDNPTAKLCDPAFLGFHSEWNAAVSTKVVAKRTADEKMGVAVDVDGRTQIIEYSDLPAEIAAQTDADGNLRLWAGSTAIHVFSRAFLQSLIDHGQELPFHIAHKVVPYLDENGELVVPRQPNAYKFERFIFDVLPCADCALIVEADRAREFNPVKNKDGADSPETARAALTRLHHDWLTRARAIIADGVTVEISPLYALDEDDVRRRVTPGTEFRESTVLE